MDRFYGASELDPVEIRRGQVEAALFSGPSAACVLLAWADGKLAGLPAYSFLWPVVGLSGSLYLKELDVSAAVRRGGVGAMLMRGLFEIAVNA